MAKYLRTFYCKACTVQANLDPVTEGVSVVECPSCDTYEYWGSAVAHTDQPLADFDFWDQQFADC